MSSLLAMRIAAVATWISGAGLGVGGVLVPAPSVRIPDGDVTAPPQAGTLAGEKFQQFRASHLWEVYSPAGSFLGRISFAEHGDLMEADGNRVWVLDHDEDGLPSVVRLRVNPPLASR